MLTLADGTAGIHAALGGPAAGAAEVVVDTGLEYRDGDPVLVRVSRRSGRYLVTDDGGATDRAGRPVGWHAPIERLVARTGLNISRSGATFVPAVEGRDIAALVLRTGETSRAVYLALLDLAEEPAGRLR